MLIPENLQVEALLLVIDKRDKQIQEWKHIANEWADVATNAKPWIDNIEAVAYDGPTLSNVIEAARKNMDDGVKYCQSITSKVTK